MKLILIKLEIRIQKNWSLAWFGLHYKFWDHNSLWTIKKQAYMNVFSNAYPRKSTTIFTSFNYWDFLPFSYVHTKLW